MDPVAARDLLKKLKDLPITLECLQVNILILEKIYFFGKLIELILNEWELAVN